MEHSFDQYPVFQANQVLTSRSLNDAFDYLDEQTRLTRANLIGIGIVCGLEIKLDLSAGTAIALSRGCGVTSEGYLILEPEDVPLVAYRPYTLPDDIDYPPFKDGNTPYTMWELFPQGEPNTTLIDTPGGFLDDKAVVLFLELKKEGLRNCSPNNCDDKGAAVTVTVRRLLIKTADLDKIIAATNKLGSGLTSGDLASALSTRLNLPDLAELRFDVLNSGPSSSDDVYAGFLNVFRVAKLSKTTSGALKAAYAAFQPLLQGKYPSDPFGNFDGLFGFLDTAPANVAQVRFLQYYFDLFEDLLRAYDEFRWKGVDLICACGPQDGLFPRHLMLGLLHPEKSGQPGQYREPFRPSPAVGCCAGDTKILLQLFTRLVEMVTRFTNAPGLPKFNAKARIDPQIRVTPSVLGDGPIAKQAIPYYYRQNGAPPLFQLWNGEKTRRNRANQNLSYRYDEYKPAAPVFVSDPLRYDLERYNFLRIEGHLGKNYQQVLSTLLLLKSQYRLPIDIVALRTGGYDESQPVDLSKESAHFQDLAVLYDTLREELLSSLAEGAMDFYDVPVPDNKLPGGTPKLPLLKKYFPNYRYPAGSVGAVYEERLASYQVIPYIDIDQTLISDPAFVGQVLRVYCVLFGGVNDLRADRRAHVVSIFYFSKLSEILPATLDALAYADFENRYQDLLALVRYFRNEITANVPADLKTFVPEAELIDQFDEVLFNCKLDPVKAVHDEYVRRVGELKKRQFLSNFLLKHPGIQHKAGVPLGGTFLIVYHGEPAPPLKGNDRILVNAAAFSGAFAAKNAVLNRNAESAILESSSPLRAAAADTTTRITQVTDAIKSVDVNTLAITDAINRVSGNQLLSENPDIKLILGSLTGKVPIVPTMRPGLDDAASKIIAAAVSELSNGTVIADFFLPYKISSDYPGIEFVLPKIPPSVSATAGCTNSDGNASVEVSVKGGEPPYDIAIDNGNYDALGAGLVLPVGAHTLKVRDAEGLESTSQSIVIPDTIDIGTPQFTCVENKYTATFTISGGTPPYTVNGKPAPANTFTTDPVASGTEVAIEVLDSVNCSLNTSLTHECPPPCDLPCGGATLRRGFRFWLPEPGDAQHQYKKLRIDKVVFSVDAAPGKTVDLSDKVGKIAPPTPAALNRDFGKAVKPWLDKINNIVAAEPTLNQGGKVFWLTLAYESTGLGRLGTLWIEYFTCLGFEIRFESVFVDATGDHQLIVGYSPAGTSIAGPDTKVSVPPFGGQSSDKCNPDKPIEQLCGEAPALKLTIAKTVQQGTKLSFKVTPKPDSPDLQFLWEVQDAKPPMGNDRKFTTTFPNSATHSVTVTAFTKAGCTATETIEVPIG